MSLEMDERKEARKEKGTCEGCGKYRMLFDYTGEGFPLCNNCVKEGKSNRYDNKCLKCGKTFTTFNRFIRVCCSCKNTIEWQANDTGYKTWRR